MLSQLQPFSVVFVGLGAILLILGMVLELRHRSGTLSVPNQAPRFIPSQPVIQTLPRQTTPVTAHVPVVTLTSANTAAQTGVTSTGLPSINPGDTRLERLEKLVQLRAQNVITEADYEQLKQRLLQET